MFSLGKRSRDPKKTRFLLTVPCDVIRHNFYLDMTVEEQQLCCPRPTLEKEL